MSRFGMWRGPRGAGLVSELQQPAGKSRKKVFSWCRRPNGFCDNPRWRVVAKQTGIGLATVIAFVNRLEELANDSANRGNQRGSLEEFSALEFAVALDIEAEQARKLYSALEHPDVGWIADAALIDFNNRNPDQEDPTANERKQRQRSRQKLKKRLDILASTGALSKTRQLEFESKMQRSDHAGLIELQLELEKLVQHVTRDPRVSQCDSVTVTPDQKDQKICSEEGFNRTSGASGNVVGLAREEVILMKADPDSSQWLKEEAPKFVVERMGGSLETANRRLDSWRERAGEAALFEVLQGAKNCEGAAFHLEVADQVKRRAI